MSETHLERVLFVTDKGEVTEAVLVGFAKSLCAHEAHEEFRKLKLRPAYIEELRRLMQQYPAKISNRNVVACGTLLWCRIYGGESLPCHPYAGPLLGIYAATEFQQWSPDDRFLGFVVRDKPQPMMFRMS